MSRNATRDSVGTLFFVLLEIGISVLIMIIPPDIRFRSYLPKPAVEWLIENGWVKPIGLR